MISYHCRYLQWDSEFFAVRIARLEDRRLTPEGAHKVMSWCTDNQIACLYFLADADDPVTTATAEGLGFRFVDTRVTLDQSVDGPQRQEGRQIANAQIRVATERDLPDLIAIARESHRDSRFYFDSGFNPSRCDDLYATWIQRSCRGYAASVFVVDFKGTPCAYATCHLSASNEGSIGLIAVDRRARGLGFGRELLLESIEFMRQRGMTSVSVVTQGRNVPSQRLYQACGFRTRSMQIWYHRWFEHEKV